MNNYELNQIKNSDPEKIFLYSYGFHHSLFEANKMIRTSDFKLITFLRNPVERVLSEHRYCMRKHQGNPKILAAHRLPAAGDPIDTASNMACKMLSGLDDKNNSIPIDLHLSYAKKALREFFL